MNNDLFGTDGIRTKIGKKPLTIENLITLGKALSVWTQQKYNKKINILLGHDPRQSSSLVKSALKTGLLLSPVTIYDAEVISTPALYAVMKKTKNYNFGIMISASHNKYQDNGIKLFDLETGKLTQHDEQKISDLFYDLLNNNDYNYSSLGQDYNYSDAFSVYKDSIKNKFSAHFLQNKKIVLDCANGATSDLAPQIFQELGATVFTINNKPNGTNINQNCGTVFPNGLKATVLKQKADFGFAFDGDGDRVCMVTHTGTIKNGDDILALLSHHNDYKNQPTIVGTIMTNHGFYNYLKQRNKTLIRTNVGDKNIAKELQEKKLLLGGEPSGHIICNDYLQMGDGIFTALKILETVNQINNKELQSFKKMPQILINLPVEKKKDLQSPTIKKIIAAHKTQLIDGRLIIRYSGTEPLLRVMIEESDYEKAKIISNNICLALQKELQ